MGEMAAFINTSQVAVLLQRTILPKAQAQPANSLYPRIQMQGNLHKLALCTSYI